MTLAEPLEGADWGALLGDATAKLIGVLGCV
jgi:hypothetical protein